MKPDQTPIYNQIPTQEAYNYWLTRIDRIEELTLNSASRDTFDIAYLLFPLMDSIAQSLFRKGLRKYLEELGISHPHLVYLIFRNGFLHNSSTYRLEYRDGTILAELSSSGGTGGFIPYDSGYTNLEMPELNMPAEKVFDYSDDNGTKRAWLKLDRLTALVRHDLTERKLKDTSDYINILAGFIINSDRPS